MSESVDPECNGLAEFDRQRAEIVYITLLISLTAFSENEVGALTNILQADKETHVSLLIDHPMLCNRIMSWSQMAAEIADGTLSPKDPKVLHNLAALVYLLILSYEDHKAPTEILESLDAVYPPLFRRFLDASSDQISVFCKFLLSIRDFLKHLTLSHTRIVIVELPVGNSLAITILKKILEPLAELELVQVSLSRNDSSRSGVTRKELLQERLQAAKPTSSDIVLYLDEWNSGANFFNLCRHLTKLLKAYRSFFLPCAFLSHRAESYDRYESFCKNHDALIARWGRHGSEFRQKFPRFGSSGKFDFFWAENDRIAGWRKFQFVGSLLSSIDETLETLMNDRNKLRTALELVLAQSQPLPDSLSRMLEGAHIHFFDSHKAYQERRDQLRRSANTLEAGGMVESLESALDLIREMYQNSGLDEGAETFAVGVALTFMERMGSPDPSNRYYFKNQAPTVVPLDGRMRRPHELTVDYIEQRLSEFER